MKEEQKRYLLIIPIILLFLIIVSTFFSFRRSGYFSLRWFNWMSIFSKKPTTTTTTTTTTTLPKSLASDNNYVQNKVNSFLKNNPNANESYATDVVYHDVAIKEKNSSICENIKTEWLKKDCYNYFKVAR
jgi:hypothetical protein